MRAYLYIFLVPFVMKGMEMTHMKETSNEVTIYDIPKDIITHHIVFPERGNRYETMKKQTRNAIAFALTCKSAHATVRDDLARYKQIVFHANAVDANGNTPLIRSITSNDLKEFVKLIQNGANVQRVNAQNTTPLHVAVLNNKTKMALMLLTSGANPNITTTSGRSLLFWARNNENKEMELILLKHNAVDVRTIRNRVCEAFESSISPMYNSLHHHYPPYIGGFYL